ncbi:MAG TPA: DNA alkylation repair protein [Candidatus Kapabacteria bacterium]|nr:DNA alkylation repair protein [Candidatus Kapabacteria bacterium]
MNASQVLRELETLGKPNYKRLLMQNHGVKEPFFGVPISELKKIQKRIKQDYQLALDLYDFGNYDAMYLAGLVADDARMTKGDLQSWVNKAYGAAIPGTTVASVAAGNPHGYALALKWVDSPKTHVAVAGWATLSAIVSVTNDADLNIAEIKRLIMRAKKEMAAAPDLVRYQMNSFIIAVGCYIKALTDFAIETAERIGPVTANLGNNSCQIPYAPDYIRKVQARGTIGKKRKSAKC